MKDRTKEYAIMKDGKLFGVYKTLDKAQHSKWLVEYAATTLKERLPDCKIVWREVGEWQKLEGGAK